MALERRYPLLEIPVKTDEERLEELVTTAQPGTLPERLVYSWAEQEGLRYLAQKRIYGSFTMWNSVVVDVLIYHYRGLRQPLVIRVQGNYWHTGSRARNDDEQAARLRADGYRVVDLWEADIRRTALAGNLGSFIEDAIYAPF